MNEYVDSKAKVFQKVEDIVRTKLKDIAQEGKNKNILKKSIDDSLEYREYNEEESLKNIENRERMYSPPKRHMESNHAYVSRDNRAYKDGSSSKADLKR